MKKYWMVAKNTWEEAVTYRASFILWRIRSVLEVLTLYFLWFGALGSQTTIFTYNRPQILTYVFGVTILTATIFSSQTHKIGGDINEGTLSNYLIRPVSYFTYYFAKDVADKFMNLFFACLEFTLLFFLLQPPVFIQTDPLRIIYFLIAVIIAIFLYFFIIRNRI